MFRGVSRPSASLYTRLCSMYVSQTRYLFELKENDDVCRRALQLGSFYLFHNLSPFLRKLGRIYSAPAVSTSELQRILKECGRGEQKMEDSVLIGCTDSGVAEFALDLGPLERPSLEAELKGTFTDLRKAFLQLRGEDAPLLSRVKGRNPCAMQDQFPGLYLTPDTIMVLLSALHASCSDTCVIQAQALLRWHETHQYCSKTGKPTQKNVSGSKRVCSANGMIYYPQMSPVVITLVSHRNRCLLARQENFPEGMYTALAGFCDIGETLEETVRREVAEEVGLEIQSLQYSGSQHWPFPNSSLMIACQATVQQDELNVNTHELEAARWFSVEEVEEALQRDRLPSKREDGTLPLWVPPKWAIAHHLIQEWVQEQKSTSEL